MSDFEAAGALALTTLTAYGLLRSWRFVVSLIRGAL